MSKERFAEIRRSLNLTREQMGRALGLTLDGARRCADWEDGWARIPGPVALAMEALSDGWRPAHMRAPDPPAQRVAA